ncbi:N-acetyltransferase family protein [Ralstonia edaphi]|uniref:GNAT family N-acetyltransferase n=1 Tax=Ralstonia edaphi TaxID=3058599 RepID=UPI003D16EC21
MRPPTGTCSTIEDLTKQGEPGWQHCGVGRRLLKAALEHARANVVTVRASLASVATYECYGFTLAGTWASSQGWSISRWRSGCPIEGSFRVQPATPRRILIGRRQLKR